MTTNRTPWHVRAAHKYGQSAVLYAALALSAPGEYALATMAGWSPYVAWLMPAVMSLYAAIGASVAKSQKTVARKAIGTPLEAEARRRSKNATTGALLALLMATAAQITWHVITADAFGPRLWVVVVVSAVPPLVAAHVLHIDPPMELPEEFHEAPAQKPLMVSQEPVSEAVKEVPTGPENAPEMPVLVSYADAAEALDVAPETVRGWANDGRVTKYDGPTAHTRRVDLRECKAWQSRRLAGV
ncbi:hypothetical protein [Streptomyces albipurpureus]|uniref:Helix-turn-helix domain-containing protein n=1 Tax=Streptomyces albipurpureus TaxID=2897419 RepID=A0ABT0UT38_9ACTN|nr:hypothetical protein [Streptomyces sp. CWNU-1]MCM2391762.1 hypothetical protein [Streptomyces sp. CWNU-1]